MKTERFSFLEMLRKELLSVCQGYTESHGIFSTAAKLFM